MPCCLHLSALTQSADIIAGCHTLLRAKQSLFFLTGHIPALILVLCAEVHGLKGAVSPCPALRHALLCCWTGRGTRKQQGQAGLHSLQMSSACVGKQEGSSGIHEGQLLALNRTHPSLLLRGLQGCHREGSPSGGLQGGCIEAGEVSGGFAGHHLQLDLAIGAWPLEEGVTAPGDVLRLAVAEFPAGMFRVDVAQGLPDCGAALEARAHAQLQHLQCEVRLLGAARDCTAPSIYTKCR